MGERNLQSAKQTLQKAIDQEPTLEAAYWGPITVSLNTQETQDYDGTAALLTQIRQKFHM